MRRPDRLASARQVKAQLDARVLRRRAILKANEKDVLEALRVIRDAAKRGDPKALGVIAFCVSPF